MRSRGEESDAMNKSVRSTAVVVLASGALVAGVANLVLAGQGGGEDPKASHSPVGDPDSALPDDVRRAKNWEQIQEQAKKNDEVVAAWNQSGKDPRSLSRAHIQASAVVAPNSLKEAVGYAEDVVHARVVKQEFLPGGYSKATLQVIGRAGVAGSDTVDVYQSGGPVPTPDGGVVLSEAEWDPVLLMGDEVVVFLWKSKSADLGPLVLPGMSFRVTDGSISGGPEVSPAARDVVGRDVTEVLAEVNRLQP
jgi:hypothetical protein